MKTNYRKFYDQYHQRFDILALSETRLTENFYNLYRIEGFEMYSRPRNNYGGGVMLYIKHCFPSELIDEFTFSSESLECVTCRVKMNGINCLIICGSGEAERRYCSGRVYGDVCMLPR